MRIENSPDVDALYIYLKDADIADTDEIVSTAARLRKQICMSSPPVQ